jgi:translocation and assembly module TamB
VGGELFIDQGLIWLPKLPPNLHPTSGRALLWGEASLTPSLVDSSSAALSDSLVASAGGAEPGGEFGVTAGGDVPNLKLDAAVYCPGNLWLRSNDLQVEMSGDLRVVREDRGPAILGALAARQGSFLFLGRRFRIERGDINFFGRPETDPELDLHLEARVSNVDYRILVTGPAKRPVLRLYSDPDMSEADIVASLLFGKPVNDLDSSQEDVMKDRMAQVLASYSATQLSNEFGSSLGIDMISFGQTESAGRRSKDSSSLVIGKYLSPRVLLKYEQMYAREVSYFLRVEYIINRAFKLETSYGQLASGVDVLWSTDY